MSTWERIGDQRLRCTVHGLEFASGIEVCLECRRAPKRPAHVAIPDYWLPVPPIVNVGVSPLPVESLVCQWHLDLFPTDSMCRTCAREDGLYQ